MLRVESVFRRAAFFALSLMLVATARAQNPPLQLQVPWQGGAPWGAVPGSPGWRAALPAMPHEKSPEAWPQPDYFSQALGLTPSRPAARFKSLALQLQGLAPGTRYIVLPVQSQAFAFSPEFRALVGAQVDWLLWASGAKATRQLDVTDAYGPSVRRLDDETIDEFAGAHPGQKLVALYLGHDGIDSAFLTVVVGRGGSRRTVHRSVALPKSMEDAFAAIRTTLPGLLREAGLLVTETVLSQQEPADFRCDAGTWEFSDLGAAGTAGAHTCHAFAVGLLLPVYAQHFEDRRRLLSPAKRAWLAHAYVWAAEQLQASESGRAMRAMAWRFLDPEAADRPVPPVDAADPVVSRLARLLSMGTRLASRPVRSGEDAREAEIKSLAAGLPAFAAAVLEQWALFPEGFSRVDHCGLERLLPGTMPSPRCVDAPAAADAPARASHAAERTLFQDWRIAGVYKDFMVLAFHKGRSDDARDFLRRVPGDVAEHPFFRRLRYEFEIESMPPGGVEATLKFRRDAIASFVQSTVDLQVNDMWFAGLSLSEHVSAFTGGADEQVRSLEATEARLFAVMRFDRFAGQGHRVARRAAGDPAFFLAPSHADVRFGLLDRPLAMMDAQAAGKPAAQPGPAAPPGLPGQPTRPAFFPEHMDMFNKPTVQVLQGLVEKSPQNLRLRSMLAVAMLKEGAPLRDALQVIDERALNQRVDERIQESHAWAMPAQALLLSGEVESARKYYERVAGLDTGSESDMEARMRLLLMDGKPQPALDAATRRMQRYGNEASVFHALNQLFLARQADRAWPVFLQNAANAPSLQLWHAAMVGHRQQGLGLRDLKGWLSANGLEKLRIQGRQTSMLYLHMQAVVDRLPSDGDIAVLEEPWGPGGAVEAQWGVSAKLTQASLEGLDFPAAHRYVQAKLFPLPDPGNTFMLPLYAWVAWQATDGKDEVVGAARKATLRWSFDELLAKAMVLALDGETDESLRFLKAARHELASPDLDRTLPAPYQVALAGYLMHRKTGKEAYRRETLDFARAYQRVEPQNAWPFSLEAVLERDPKKQAAAACRAQRLDAQSYFLKQAAAAGVKAAACDSSRR